MVKIFNFTMFDIVSGESKLSPSMATRSTLERLRPESILPGPVEIDPKRLDGNGMIARSLVASVS